MLGSLMQSLEELVSDNAHYISRRVFTAEEIYRQEKRYIFGKSWLYLSHESQVPNAGDFITTTMGEAPVIVSRHTNGKVSASLNSCAHRGLPVARGDRGNAKRFVCPYHAWSYDSTGKLCAVPQERKLGQKVCREKNSLKSVPRVEIFCGLIFGCMDAEVESLENFLGDMRFYIECMFDRSSGGALVVGAPQKWMINCNWKVPVENQLGDVAHGPILHGAILKGSPQVDDIEKYGFNVVPKAGHGLAVRLYPEDAPVTERIHGMDGLTMYDQETIDYMSEQHAEVEQRLGKLRGRIKPLCYSVYPNLSLLWPNNTLRVSHPRGPGKTEYWSWFVVDKNIPDSVKIKLQRNYTMMFGPGGLLEQEDSEAWTQQYIGNSIDYAEDRHLYFGLGEGEEGNHPELPGKVGNVVNEFYVREFYKRWRQEIETGMKVDNRTFDAIALKNLA